MFTSLEAAIQTLEESNALTYTISQGPNLKLMGEAATVQELLDKFQTDWEKLSPNVYRVDYSKNPNDKRTGLCFRVSKTTQANGSPQAVAGIGGPNDYISGLQQQIWNLQKDSELTELKRQHQEELRKLKEKDEDGLGMLAPLIGVIPRLESVFYQATGRMPLPTTAPAVAGPALPPATGAAPTAEGADLNDNGQRLAHALDKLEGGLGGDTLVSVLEKLASKDPDKLRGMVGMIDML